MIEDLIGKSTVKRRKAAIALRKDILSIEGLILLDALKLEEGKNNWKTQIEIIKTIGIKGLKEASQYIRMHFIDHGRNHSLLSSVAATCCIRLQRDGLDDIGPFYEIIKNKKYSTNEGALEALGYDRMVPAVEEQYRIIEQFGDFGNDRPKGLTDPRYGLAAACAGWTANNVKKFLINCINAKDVPLKYIAENSLNKRYVKLR